MLVQGTGNCWIVAAFYLNRDRIAATVCINRFDLIPVCRGACFLERKLNENETRQEKSLDIKYKEITLFCEYNITLAEQPIPIENPFSFCDYVSPHFPHLYISHIFKPPIQLI